MYMFEQQNYAEMADHNSPRKLPCNEPCLGNSPTSDGTNFTNFPDNQLTTVYAFLKLHKNTFSLRIFSAHRAITPSLKARNSTSIKSGRKTANINTKNLRSFITVKAHCSMTHLEQQKSLGFF